MRTPCARIVGPCLASATLVLGLAFLGSCSYLIDDPYPAFTQRVLAWADLDAAVKQISGGSSLEFADSLNYLESGTASGVFVRLATKDGAGRLLTLDGNDLDRPVGYQYGVDSIGLETGLSATGQFVSGAVAMAPTTRLEAATVPYDPGILLSQAGDNYFFSSGGNLLGANHYDSAWTPLGSLSTPISASGSWELVEAGQGGGWYCFLFQLSGSSTFRAFRTPSIVSMSWTSLFDDPTVPADYTTPAFTADRYSTGITADGPVVRRNSIGNGDRLSLIRFGPVLASADYSPRNSSSVQYFYEPSGRYWFLYESGTARLFKLRTWWK